MTKLPTSRSAQFALGAVVMLILAALAWEWYRCDGTLVRTLLWVRCIP